MNDKLEVLESGTNFDIDATFVEEDKLIAFGYNEGRVLITFDEELNILDRVTVDSSGYRYECSRTLMRIDENLYYTCYGFWKIEDNIFKPKLGYNSDISEYNFTDLKLIGDYILLSGLYDDGNGVKAVVTIFDKELNLIEEIDVNKLFGKDYSSVSVVKNVYLTENGFALSAILNDYSLVVAEFSIKFNVEAKTDGNGTINISSVKNFSNDEILFEIVPNEGYVLSSVKVIDAEGNEITFTKNSFVMPSKDVIVKASFKKIEEDSVENPNTLTSGIIHLVILLIIVTISLGYFYKKIKYSR